MKSQLLQRLPWPLQALALLAALLAAAPAPAPARIVSIDIASTTPAFGGREFGTVGAYEVVRAIAR